MIRWVFTLFNLHSCFFFKKTFNVWWSPKVGGGGGIPKTRRVDNTICYYLVLYSLFWECPTLARVCTLDIIPLSFLKSRHKSSPLLLRGIFKVHSKCSEKFLRVSSLWSKSGYWKSWKTLGFHHFKFLI